MRPTTPLRVVFFPHAAAGGGAETALTRLVHGLDKSRVEGILLSAREGPAVQSWRESGCPVEICPQPWLIYPLRYPEEMAESVARARAWLERLDPDLVVSNTTVLYAGARAAAELGLPLVVWSHGIVSEHLFPELDTENAREYERSLYELASCVLAPSPWVARHVCTLTPGVSVHVVPNGLPIPERWEPLSAAPERFEFVMFCSPEQNKRILLAVDAITLLRTRHPELPAVLVHYGTVPSAFERHLRDHAAGHGAEQWVEFRGHTTDLAEAYRPAFAAVVASDVESFSYVAVEAMAHGRPVIATRCGGPEGIVIDGETGLLVPRNDPEALCEAMLALAMDPARARALGLAGRRMAEKRYGITRVARQIQRVFQDAADTRWEVRGRDGGLRLGEKAMRVQAEATRQAAQPTNLDSTTPVPVAAPTPHAAPAPTPSPQEMELHAAPPLSGRRAYVLEPERDRLSSVDVLLGLHQRRASGQLVLSIYADANGAALLRRVPEDLSPAQDNCWFRFSFAPVINSAGRRLLAVFEMENPGPETKVSLYQRGSSPRSLMARARRRYLTRGARLYSRLGYGPSTEGTDSRA